MNYDQARQVESTGKWFYTSRNDDRIHAIGYCSKFIDCPVCHGTKLMQECPGCNGKAVVENPTPCQGHDTREGAERHYYEWELDHLREGTWEPDPAVQDGRLKCKVCGSPTLKFLHVIGDGFENITLCDEHRNREGFEQGRPFIPGVTVIHS